MNTLRFEVSALNGAPRVTAVETPKAEQLYRNGPTVPARERNPAKEITVGSVTVQIFGRAPGPFTIAWRECAGGPRKRAMRSSFPAAKIFANKKATELANGQTAMNEFNDADRASFRRVCELNAPIGKPLELTVAEHAVAIKRATALGLTIEQIFTFAEQNYPKGAITKACQDVFDEMLQRMEKDRRGERWIDDLRSRIGRFAKDYTGPVHELRAPFINEWLASLDVGPRSRNNYRVALQALVAYAKSRNYLPRSWDEMAHVDIAAQEPGEIEIWTPEQCYAFLVRCRPNLVPFVALQFFAGIRHAELDRLDWSHINLDTGNIYIPSHIAKRKTPKRNIPIQPNLAAWLQPHAAPYGRPGKNEMDAQWSAKGIYQL
jgi:hypothetical protein